MDMKAVVRTCFVLLFVFSRSSIAAPIASHSESEYVLFSQQTQESKKSFQRSLSGLYSIQSWKELDIAQPYRDFTQLYQAATLAQLELETLMSEVALVTNTQSVIPGVKSEHRAKQKIETELKGEAHKITDLARCSLVAKDIPGLVQAFELLNNEVSVVAVKNRFKSPTASGYRDLKMLVRLPKSQMVAEIQLHLGLDDALYIHQRGLITKREIRVVGLSQLEIQPHHRVWDLGAGCGSVAIEASLLAHEGEVIAVEKDASRAKSIQKNVQRTGAYGVQVVHDSLPDCLDSLPEPDRIFIGGGTGHGINVLEQASERLKAGGKVVLHLVLMGSLERARNYLLDLGWPVNITQVQISRSESLAGDQRLEALNPVFILSATKPE